MRQGPGAPSRPTWAEVHSPHTPRERGPLLCRLGPPAPTPGLAPFSPACPSSQFTEGPHLPRPPGRWVRVSGHMCLVPRGQAGGLGDEGAQAAAHLPAAPHHPDRLFCELEQVGGLQTPVGWAGLPSAREQTRVLTVALGLSPAAPASIHPLSSLPACPSPASGLSCPSFLGCCPGVSQGSGLAARPLPRPASTLPASWVLPLAPLGTCFQVRPVFTAHRLGSTWADTMSGGARRLCFPIATSLTQHSCAGAAPHSCTCSPVPAQRCSWAACPALEQRGWPRGRS